MSRISIRYCEVWNYLPRASRVAALIKQSLNADADVVPGGRGEFTVWVDGRKVAEKGRSGFPAEKALLETVGQALALSEVEGLE